MAFTIAKIIGFTPRLAWTNSSSSQKAATNLFTWIQFTLTRLENNFKDQKSILLRQIRRQCECVVLQRMRRSQQPGFFYCKMWEEPALRDAIRRVQQRLSLKHIPRAHGLLLGVALLTYDWDKRKITDEQLLKHLTDIDYIYMLQEETLTCPVCGLRLVIDHIVDTITYCTCDARISAFNKATPGIPWRPFLERQDMLIWRQEHLHHSGLYAYKVYGKYDDVTANDFLRVQTDTEYRKTWDPTASTLRVVESHKETNSDIIYWEMEWPRMFANRDYVFNRRYLVDQENNLMVIISRATEHPSCPATSGNHRVEEYWSVMLIKPQSDFNEPGIEFALTYFDNPGLSIPSAVSSWVAVSGMPDFLTRLRQAALTLAEERKKTEEQDSKFQTPNQMMPNAPASPPEEGGAKPTYLQKPQPVYA